jgi:uncharacterized RDD family membrane protein YckC
VELEDRITIATPEGIELQLQLAGAASRFIAGGIDFAIRIVLIALIALVAGAVGGGGGFSVAIVSIALFTVIFLYDIPFEVLAAGRTPGKRISHLRVVRDQGAPVDLRASAVRNLLRLLDGPMFAYLPSLFSILLTARNQRPGDLAAGTVVIRDMPRGRGGREPAQSARAPAGTAGWDVSAISDEEVAAVRRFLARRDALDRRARRELAHRLEQGLRPKVAGAASTADPERFLEALAEAKAAR